MLTPSELAELESTLLPALERHHLRLLAHALRTLQQIAGRNSGPAPDAAAIHIWLNDQPALVDDPAFRDAFAGQLASAADQLTELAGPDRSPLALDLPDLITWSRRSADQRLGAAGAG